MKLIYWGLLLVVLLAAPSLSFAKGVPLFFQTGDELFEIEGAPTFEDGFSVGYACQRFGLFGADLWTWGCDLMAINIEQFAAGDLDPKLKAEMESQYSTGDRVRNPWNHYGGLILVLLLVGFFVSKATGKSKTA